MTTPYPVIYFPVVDTGFVIRCDGGGAPDSVQLTDISFSDGSRINIEGHYRV